MVDWYTLLYRVPLRIMALDPRPHEHAVMFVVLSVGQAWRRHADCHAVPIPTPIVQKAVCTAMLDQMLDGVHIRSITAHSTAYRYSTCQSRLAAILQWDMPRASVVEARSGISD